ncbi:MAG: iron-sulfur cluster assembly accessory protein [Bacteroidia bacterium]|nr:iron-sulfur cluster assembly accessory protein [Bacteroidia bacterium]MDW8334256.1 iron-sulfur cluster assembly accessory protein [Bacteroidia bacterium]
METTTAPPLLFTPRAIEEIKAIRERENRGPNERLRVGVKGGGCSGMTYVLTFDQKTDWDREFEFDGVRIIIDRRHEMYLTGMRVEYDDGLNARGFSFVNPNAKTTCGCGTSFAV